MAQRTTTAAYSATPPLPTQPIMAEVVVAVNPAYQIQNQQIIDAAVREIESRTAQQTVQPRTTFKIIQPESDRGIATSVIGSALPSSRGFVLISASASPPPSSSGPITAGAIASTPIQTSQQNLTQTTQEVSFTQAQQAFMSGSQPQTGSFVAAPNGPAVASSSSFTTTPVSSSNDIIPVPTSADEDSVFFGANSFLNIPINPEFSEKIVGLELLKWEKPKIICVGSEFITSGYPTNNLIFIKKLTSPRASLKKYTIYKKDVFRDRNFSVLVELSSEQISMPAKYTDMVAQMGFSATDVFMFEDKDLRKNTNFIYKVECVWISTGPPPPENFNFNIFFPNIFSGSMAMRFLQ